jgi:hypothetical protein
MKVSGGLGGRRPTFYVAQATGVTPVGLADTSMFRFARTLGKTKLVIRDLIPQA